MIFRTGNMFDHPADLYLVTTNATIRRDGGLVMGRGAAKEATLRYPSCQQNLGQAIRKLGNIRDTYGVVIDPLNPIGAFQVKYNFNDTSNLDLIRYSSGVLKRFLPHHPQYQTISLNFPGIGNGRLSREKVLPVLEEELGELENLTIWEKS